MKREIGATESADVLWKRPNTSCWKHQLPCCSAFNKQHSKSRCMSHRQVQQKIQCHVSFGEPSGPQNAKVHMKKRHEEEEDRNPSNNTVTCEVGTCALSCLHAQQTGSTQEKDGRLSESLHTKTLMGKNMCGYMWESRERGKAETVLLCQELIINKWGTELTKRLKTHLPPCVKENRPNYQDLRHKLLTKKQRLWWSLLGLFYHSDMLKKKKLLNL